MGRILLLASVALLLGGCADTDWARAIVHPFGQEAAAPRPAPVTTPQSRACVSAARNRASAVADQGFGEQTRQSVYDAAYADCMQHTDPALGTD